MGATAFQQTFVRINRHVAKTVIGQEELVSVGGSFVTPDDVEPMVSAVLRHRIVLHRDAQLQGISPDERIHEIVRGVPVARLAA